jgi:HK97 family phage major capsid protein
MSKLKDLQEERGQIIHESRAILDKADAEKRALTTEEKAKYDELFVKQDDIKSAIEREMRQLEIEREAAAQHVAGAEKRTGSRGETTAANPGTGRASDEYRASFNRYLLGGPGAISAEEYRDLSMGADIAGGFTVAPEQFVSDIIRFVDNMVFIRSEATKFTLNGAGSLGVPSLDADPNDCDWTSELQMGQEDTGMAFGKRSFTPHPLAKQVKISNKLLQQSAVPVESLVMERLGYKFGITEEKAFQLGNGVNQPLGVFVATPDGIDTTRDINSGNTTTSITFDGLIAAKYALKVQYWAKAKWLFNRTTMQQISQLKDGEGQYIWRAAVVQGEPDKLLNLPYMMSEYTPNTMTTGAYVGIIGDFSKYWIVDSLVLQMQRLIELYAATNQIGFIGRKETDGMPVLAEAFARVKLS